MSNIQIMLNTQQCHSSMYYLSFKHLILRFSFLWARSFSSPEDINIFFSISQQRRKILIILPVRFDLLSQRWYYNENATISRKTEPVGLVIAEPHVRVMAKGAVDWDLYFCPEHLAGEVDVVIKSLQGFHQKVPPQAASLHQTPWKKCNPTLLQSRVQTK